MVSSDGERPRGAHVAHFVEDQLTVTFLIKKLLTKCVCTSVPLDSFILATPAANQLRNYHSTTPHTWPPVG